MRGWLAGLLALGLLLGAAGPVEASSEDAFWWDVYDTGITTQSTGTGGTPENRPAKEQRGLEMRFMRPEGFATLEEVHLQVMEAYPP